MAPKVRVLHQLCRLIAAPASGLRHAVVFSCVGDAASVALGTLAPVILKAIVDHAQARPIAEVRLTFEVIALAVATLAPNIIAGVRQAQITEIVENLTATLSLQCAKVQMSAADAPAGSLAASLARLPFALQLIIDGLAARVAPTIVQVAASLAVLATSASVQETVILAITLGAYALVVDIGVRRSRHRSKKAHEDGTAFSQRLGDVLHNTLRVRANDAAAVELTALEELAKSRTSAFRNLARQAATDTFLQTGLLLAGAAVLMMLSIKSVLAGKASIGEFVLLQSYIFRLALPIGGIAVILRQSTLAFETVADVASAAQTAVRVETAKCPAQVDLNAGLRCRDVSYRAGTQPLLQCVSFDLERGSYTALIGANGSGKSTLARLLAGLIEPDTGTVEMFGVDAALLSASERRRRVLYVPQFVGLFDRTLADNGLYPPSRLTKVELTNLLNSWRFYSDDHIVDLDLNVGEAGQNLSGGQIQKLELARLTAVSPQCLILDETTSALDPSAERCAIAALRAASPDTALLLVTHARRIAEQADQVIFVNQGKVAGLDTHARLMRRSSAYRTFWRGGRADAARSAAQKELPFDKPRFEPGSEDV